MSDTKTFGYEITLREAEEGGYTALVLDLPGCISQGDTAEEAIQNIKEAAINWIASTQEQGKSIPDCETVKRILHNYTHSRRDDDEYALCVNEEQIAYHKTKQLKRIEELTNALSELMFATDTYFRDSSNVSAPDRVRDAIGKAARVLEGGNVEKNARA